MYYKFHPKNHIFSLGWAAFMLIIGLTEVRKEPDIVIGCIVIGTPPIVCGITIRERIEKNKRKKIIKYIREKMQVTVGQIANLLDVSGQEARNILNSLVKEERLQITNRSTDMEIVYIMNY